MLDSKKPPARAGQLSSNMSHQPFLPADLDRLRATLAKHLPFSPLDYIPGISRKGDRAILAEQLTEPVAPDDDLRLGVELPSGRHVAVLCQRLPWDSEFFGYGVARLHGMFLTDPPVLRTDVDLRPAVDKLLAQAQRRQIRYLFAQVDPRDLALIRALGESGFALIETRLFHYGPVHRPESHRPLPVRLARPEDIPSLAQAASQTVNPFDRFHADPFIDPAAAARLMERWVEQSVLGKMADLMIVPDAPAPGAFVTYRLHRQNWPRWGVNLAQGVLSAVAPEFMGWMGDLDPEMQCRLHDLNVQWSFGSTQVTNRAILWFAQEVGARFGRCEHVLRIVL